MKITAIYIRVSTKDQNQNSQRDALNEYCARRGWKDTETYEDTISGSTGSRPRLDALLGAIRAGLVERVVCTKLDRLGRSLTHLALLIEELTKAQTALVCITQGIDTGDDNPAGRLQLNILCAVAQFEREIIKERVAAGLASAKARGIVGGRPLIRHLKFKELYEGGISAKSIAKAYHLTEDKVKVILARNEKLAEPPTLPKVVLGYTSANPHKDTPKI